MIIDNLKNGRYVLEEGVVSTLTPITKIDDIEAELRKEIEAKMTEEINKEIVVREFGRVIGFITENNWKVFYPTGKADEVVIAAPFNGGEMVHTVKSTKVDESGKKETEEVIKNRIYIPCGYLTINMRIGAFPKISNSQYRIIPNLKNKTAKEIYTSYEGGLFASIHPHTNGDSFCSGLQNPEKFDINYIIELLRAGIVGSQKAKESSIWDYNGASPMNHIENCSVGKFALELFKKGLSDQEIWMRIMEKKAKGE